MKKLLLFFFVFLLACPLWAQTISFRGTVYDAVAYIPVKAANILNLNTGKYQFTDSEGVFVMKVSFHDTLIISTSTYRQKVVIIDDNLYRKGHEDILLYHKAFMLQEVRVIALNPTYEGLSVILLTPSCLIRTKTLRVFILRRRIGRMPPIKKNQIF